VPRTSWDFSKILAPGAAEPFQAPRLRVQAKLKLGAVNDPPEHEADRVAGEVMRMPEPDATIRPATRIDAVTKIKGREQRDMSRENETKLTTENEKALKAHPSIASRTNISAEVPGSFRGGPTRQPANHIGVANSDYRSCACQESG
jgi:hypothetical protein